MAQFKPYNFDKDIALNAAKQLKQTSTGTNGVKYDAPQTNIYSQPQKNTYSPPQTNTYSQPQTNTFSYSTPTQTAYPEVQTYMQLLDKQNESEKNSPFASSAGLDESLFEGLDGVMSPITRNYLATLRQLQNEQIEKDTQQALRDNYVSQKLSEYYLPDQMARLGLAGQGASEQANIDMLNIYRNAAAKLKQQESEQKRDADKRILEMLMPYYEKAWEENKAKEEEKAATDASLDFDALLEAASGNLVNGKFTETDYNNLINFLKQNRDALGEGKYGDYTNLLRERGYVTQEEANAASQEIIGGKFRSDSRFVDSNGATYYANTMIGQTKNITDAGLPNASDAKKNQIYKGKDGKLYAVWDPLFGNPRWVRLVKV